MAGVQPEWTPTAAQAALTAAWFDPATATVELRASQKFANSGRLVKPS